MQLSVKQFADDWIELQRLGDSETASEDVFARGYVLNDFAYDQPDLALAVIKEVISRYTEGDLLSESETEAQRVLGMTAAGPLEQLLAENGLSVIGEVETEAQLDRRFLWTLGRVWKNAMTDEVWERVQKAVGDTAR